MGSQSAPSVTIEKPPEDVIERGPAITYPPPRPARDLQTVIRLTPRFRCWVKIGDGPSPGAFHGGRHEAAVQGGNRSGRGRTGTEGHREGRERRAGSAEGRRPAEERTGPGSGRTQESGRDGARSQGCGRQADAAGQ